MNDIENIKNSKLHKITFKLTMALSFYSESKVLSILILFISISLLILNFIFIPQPYTVIGGIFLGFFIGVRTLIVMVPKHIFRTTRAKEKFKSLK